MRTELDAGMETSTRLEAKACWRVAVTQGLTLLGFNDWVIECTGYPHEVCESETGHANASGAQAAYAPRAHLAQAALLVGDL